MAHGHDDCDEESLVTNFGKDDHGKGEDQGVEWLNEGFFRAARDHGSGWRGFLSTFGVGERGFEVLICDGNGRGAGCSFEVVILDALGFGGWDVMRL